ncbi:MAG: sulfate reduction electron transfer complex DsrMKJOP subunit DsrJ [Actinomycetota bacterium]|nr:sulfate reduction electron transfer complex DsrMKJOP subunit DsrJ [Actinomycetota bacterium]
MYNGGKIILGLAIFVGLIAIPFIKGATGGTAQPNPSTDTPAIQKLAVKQCIEPTTYMKANHMEILHKWMDAVTSGATNTTFTSPTTGQAYPMALDTCFGCHSNKKQFCDRCHNYMAVKLPCFQCHQDPEAAGASGGADSNAAQ